MSPDALTHVSIRCASADDALRLSVLARDAFISAFGPHNTPEDMAMYVAASFGENVQRAEIEESRNTFLVAERGDELIGYVMLREGAAPNAVPSRNALEINRLYASHHEVGAGIGAALMQRSIAEAEIRGRDVIWLAVWEHNPRAIRFYERWGFEDVGTQEFTLGADRQTDRIMSRAVIR